MKTPPHQQRRILPLHSLSDDASSVLRQLRKLRLLLLHLIDIRAAACLRITTALPLRSSNLSSLIFTISLCRHENRRAVHLHLRVRSFVDSRLQQQPCVATPCSLFSFSGVELSYVHPSAAILRYDSTISRPHSSAATLRNDSTISRLHHSRYTTIQRRSLLTGLYQSQSRSHLHLHPHLHLHQHPRPYPASPIILFTPRALGRVLDRLGRMLGSDKRRCIFSTSATLSALQYHSAPQSPLPSA